MIPLATIQIGEDRNTYDINAVFTDASTVLGSWEPIAGQVQVRCHLSAPEAVAFVCAAIAAYAPVTTSPAEPDPTEPEPPTLPLGCVSRSADPDIPHIRNKKNNIVGSDLKDPREVTNQNLKQINPVKTTNFVLNKYNPLGLNIQESMIYKRA
jgi:hypothetical protein